MAEQTGDFISSIRALMQSEIAEINTSVNGEVVSYSDGLATIQPLANKRFPDGDVLGFPPIPNVPIRWPSFNGGQCGIKGPIRKGDKVLLVFAQQAIDGTDDERRFDLSDAYAIPCDSGQVAQSSNNDDMVMWFGSAYIKITADGKLEINAPGGSKTISPNNEFTGNNEVKGNNKVDGNQQTIGTTTNTGTTSMNGGFNSTGSATNNSKNIGSTHTHIGVQTGGGVSGPPS